MNRDYYMEGYTHGPPNDEVGRMDAEIAECATCPHCGAQCQYDAWHKEGSYIALVVCPECDWDREF